MGKNKEDDILKIKPAREFVEHLLQCKPPYTKLPYDDVVLCGLPKIENITIDIHCDNCGDTKTFQGNLKARNLNIEPFKEVSKATGYYYIGIPNHSGVTPTIADARKELDEHPDNTNLILSCAKCGFFVYFQLLITGKVIFKIGQYPSFANEEAAKVKKYKNIIPKYYEELTRSLNAYSQGMHIAAFVYLRRIYEDLINKRYTGSVNTKFIDKLKEVEEREKIIPDELNEIKNQLYSVLSKGVHEYSENDCGQLYPILRFCVESILDIELAKKEQKKKADEAKKAISTFLTQGGTPHE